MDLSDDSSTSNRIDPFHEVKNSISELSAELESLRGYRGDLMDETTDSLISNLLTQIDHARDLIKEEKERLKIKQLRIDADDDNEFWISDIDDDEVRLYGKALQNNKTVEKLSIDQDARLTDVENAELLIDFVRNSETLKKLELRFLENITLTRSLVRAASENVNIQEVEIDEIPMVIGMARMLIFQSKSLQILRIFEFSEGWTPDIDMKTAFRENLTLHTLDLINARFHPGNPFSNLGHAIMISQSLRELSLQACNFDFVSTQALLELLCRKESNIVKLLIFKCSFKAQGEQLFGDAMFFELIINQALETTLEEIKIRDVDDVARILRPFQNGKTFECIHLDGFREEDINTLSHALPLLRGLKRLRVHTCGDRIIKAMRKNFCLRELSMQRNNDDDEVEEVDGWWQRCQKKINLLCSRNIAIQNWISAPHGMCNSYLPRVLHQCLYFAFDAELIFCMLQKHNWPVGDINGDSCLTTSVAAVQTRKRSHDM